jgi:hypothetical protein
MLPSAAPRPSALDPNVTLGNATYDGPRTSETPSEASRRTLSLACHRVRPWRPVEALGGDCDQRRTLRCSSWMESMFMRLLEQKWRTKKETKERNRWCCVETFRAELHALPLCFLTSSFPTKRVRDCSLWPSSLHLWYGCHAMFSHVVIQHAPSHFATLLVSIGLVITNINFTWPLANVQRRCPQAQSTTY